MPSLGSTQSWALCCSESSRWPQHPHRGGPACTLHSMPSSPSWPSCSLVLTVPAGKGQCGCCASAKGSFSGKGSHGAEASPGSCKILLQPEHHHMVPFLLHSPSAPFLGPLLGLAESPIYAVRTMAAKALVPVVPPPPAPRAFPAAGPAAPCSTRTDPLAQRCPRAPAADAGAAGLCHGRRGVSAAMLSLQLGSFCAKCSLLATEGRPARRCAPW